MRQIVSRLQDWKWKLSGIALLVVILTFPVTSLQAQGKDTQKGERVLSPSEAAADAPKRRKSYHPWVELFNLRKENPASRHLLIDYRIVEGKVPLHYLLLVLKSEKGIEVCDFPVVLDSKGTFSIHLLPPASVPEKVEVWAETSDRPFMMITGRTPGYKISKSLLAGGATTTTYAREWTEQEQKADELQQKMQLPAPPAPAGFVIVNQRSSELLPGMPILASWQGEWGEAEFLSLNTNTAQVLWKSEKQQRPKVSTVDFTRMAVATKTLEAGKSRPDDFKPSMRVLPLGNSELPSNLSPLTDDIALVPGTPLKRETFPGKWHDVIFMNNRDGHGTVNITEVDITGRRVITFALTRKLAIEDSVAERLKQPDAKEHFAPHLEEAIKNVGMLEKSPGLSRSKPARNYSIQLPIPPKGTLLDNDLFVPKGTKLGACWGQKWYDLIALSDSEPGQPVECRWLSFRSNWDEPISRSSLIIPKADAAKLRKQMEEKENSVAEEPAPKEAPSLAGSAPQNPPAMAAAPKTLPEEKTSPPPAQTKTGDYELILDDAGSTRFRVAREVMGVTGLNLKDCVEMIKEAPISLSSSLTEEEAKKFQQKIKQAGGKASIKKNE